MADVLAGLNAALAQVGQLPSPRVLVCSQEYWDAVRDAVPEGPRFGPGLLYVTQVYIDAEWTGLRYELVDAEEYYARCTCGAVDLGGLVSLGPFVPYPVTVPNPNCPKHRPTEETP